MVSPYADSHAHEHEWVVDERNEPVLEDSSVFVRRECMYAEDKYVGTDKRGESYYETMYECDASQYVRFDITAVYEANLHGVVTLADGRDEVVSLHDESPVPIDRIEQRAAERLCEGADGYPEALEWVQHDSIDTSDKRIEVPTESATFQLRFEFGEVSRQ